MKSFITGFITLTLVGMLGLAACGPEQTPAQKAANQEETIKWNLAKKVMASIQAGLKDPSSAKFGTVVVLSDRTVCGSVNAKNSFGGYTGEKGFVLTAGGDLFFQEGQKDFRKIWANNCADKSGMKVN